MSQDGEVQWEFYDSQGRLIFNKTNFYSQGAHIFEIDGTNIDIHGLIYIKLRTADDVAEFKMVKI